MRRGLGRKLLFKVGKELRGDGPLVPPSWHLWPDCASNLKGYRQRSSASPQPPALATFPAPCLSVSSSLLAKAFFSTSLFLGDETATQLRPAERQ